MLIPAYIKYLSLPFLGLLIANIPSLAYHEEMKFRKGTKSWKHAIWRSLRFGLAHCVVGVPLFAGLALAIGGLWFTRQYFKGGEDFSTVHHLAYNLIAVAVILISLCVHRIAF